MRGMEPVRRFVAEHVRSVRLRIVASVVLLAGMALSGAGTAAYFVENSRMHARIDEAIHQEIQEFEELHRSGVDPRTGGRFAEIGRLFRVALQHNVPEEHEAIIGYVGDATFVHPRTSFPLARYQPFVAAVNAVGDNGGWGRVQTPEGEVRFAVKPVVQDGSRGQYVVAYFTAPERAEFADVVRTYAVVAAMTLGLLTVVAWVVAGRMLRPLRLLHETAREITDTDLSRRIPVTGNDNVSDLARTFNAMLDRLETAFGDQRRFLDDAGHELRTPVTIVRGHLELLDSADPADVTATRELVLDELDRMGRLVEDLIVLAKSGRPDFLEPRPVALGELTDDVLAKARALGHRDWQLDARAEGTIVADAQRLTQALTQLCSNAVAHTGPGDTIAIGSSAGEGDDVARLWVRDTGPGVDPGDAERIFERFERGRDAPRGTGSGAGSGTGSGLGLSIVRAIAEAHGGSVGLDSHPSDGALFTLRVRRGDRPRPDTLSGDAYTTPLPSIESETR